MIKQIIVFDEQVNISVLSVILIGSANLLKIMIFTSLKDFGVYEDFHVNLRGYV